MTVEQTRQFLADATSDGWSDHDHGDGTALVLWGNSETDTLCISLSATVALGWVDDLSGDCFEVPMPYDREALRCAERFQPSGHRYFGYGDLNKGLTEGGFSAHSSNRRIAGDVLAHDTATGKWGVKPDAGVHLLPRTGNSFDFYVNEVTVLSDEGKMLGTIAPLDENTVVFTEDMASSVFTADGQNFKALP